MSTLAKRGNERVSLLSMSSSESSRLIFVITLLPPTMGNVLDSVQNDGVNVLYSSCMCIIVACQSRSL
jgi:hypothetical protein